MNLSTIGIEQWTGPTGRQDSRDGNGEELFDLLVAAAAAHAASTHAAGFTSFTSGSGERHTSELNVTRDAATPALSSVSVAAPLQAQPEEVSSASGAPSAVSDSYEQSRTQDGPDETAPATRQGTLPVIVAGQLIELELLRERRLTRDAAPARRLSMVLEAGTSGSVSVGASLRGDCLVIELEGSAIDDAGRRSHYVGEVQTLARRLGWNFQETMCQEMGEGVR